MNLAQCGWSEHAISVSTCAIRMQPYLMFSVSGTLLLQIPTDTRLLLSFSTNVLEAPRILLDLCVDSFTCTLERTYKRVPPTHWTVWVVLWGLWSTLVWQWFLEREKHCWQPTNSSLWQRLESAMISLNPSGGFLYFKREFQWRIMMNHDESCPIKQKLWGATTWRPSRPACRLCKRVHGEATLTSFSSVQGCPGNIRKAWGGQAFCLRSVV